jgi:hypothetical protein
MEPATIELTVGRSMLMIKLPVSGFDMAVFRTEAETFQGRSYN